MGTHPIFESDFDCLTAMVQRLTYRRIGKAAKAPTCGDTGTVLRGIKAGRPRQLAQFQTPKDRYPCLRWIPLWRCCPLPYHPCFPHRRTEDCRKGIEDQATSRQRLQVNLKTETIECLGLTF